MGSYERKDEVDERNARYVADTKDRTANPEKTSWREKHVTKRRLLLLLPVILVLSSYTGQVLYNTYGPGTCNLLPGQKPNTPPPTRVGLVDTLAYDYPDHDFVQQISTAAHDHGQGFDYYTPSSLSLNTFVHLPTDGYSMLIFRTHIAYSTSSATSFHVAITTSEPYDNYRYAADQATDRVANVNQNGSFYFGLTPQFVTQRMCGSFPGTIVMAMGCYAMNSTDISSAFVEKGASTFIGWKGIVRVDQTDQAYEKLVPLLLNGTSVQDAIQTVMGNETIAYGQPVLTYQN